MSQSSRITSLAQRVATEFKSLRANELGGIRQVRLTKAQYQALTGRDGKTIYTVSDWTAQTGLRDLSGVSNIASRYRADSIIGLADGAKVALWPDTGGTNDATQSIVANQPTFVASSVNSKPAVRWTDSSTASLLSAASTSSPLQTIMAVVKPTTAGVNTSAATIRGASANTGLQLRLSAGKQNTLLQSTTDLGSASTALSADTPYVLIAMFTSNEGMTWKANGSSQGSSAIKGSPNSGLTTVIGANGTSGLENWKGDILEIVTWNKILTLAEIVRVDSYVQDQYNISVTDYQ